MLIMNTINNITITTQLDLKQHCVLLHPLQPAIVPKVDPPTTMGLTLGNTNDSPIDNSLCDPRAEGRIPPLLLCFLTLTIT